ncbi:NAD(P)/FAD-dependent oxidoreductase [Demetria terragena]|uniref:NAD(P)/FAD-dependent oxidoreductase n=1 Tax=Demetria terragena TaxID=63959 RepID=UPI0003A621BD|nr:FAD-dependent oxidoreductase [Demetria terragena]
MTTYVIVGGGLAGAKTAEALRERDGDARVVLISAEAHLPYERPALSKGFLAGKESQEDFTVHESSWYQENLIEVRSGTFADAIDPATRTVTLSDGSAVAYDQLALATGSRPRGLGVPGVQRPGVVTLRTIEEAAGLREVLGKGKRLVVIGGGWIGLEVAASARELGAEVTILEGSEHVLLKALGASIGDRFAELHRSHGVDVRTGISLDAIEGEGTSGAVTGVRLKDGETIPADAVLLAVGALPRVELAAAAGLDVDNGLVVDDTLRTSDSHIVAVGDIAHAEHPTLGHRVRVEHWANAQAQADIAAATMVGDEAHYDALPYFFTDQYDLGMEFRGERPDDERVIQRGSDSEHILFWLDAEDIVRAAMNVNVWDAGDDIEALLASGQPIDAERLADPTVSLSSLIDS